MSNLIPRWIGPLSTPKRLATGDVDEGAPKPVGAKCWSRPAWARRLSFNIKFSLDIGLLLLATLAMFRLPPRLLPLLCLWSAPLCISSHGT